MSDIGYLVTAYVVTAVALGAYMAILVRRSGRRR